MSDGLDEYGTVTNDVRGALLVAVQLFTKNLPIVFAWSHNQIDCYIFTIAHQFNVIGTMPFGGNPRGRCYISLYGKGSNHFSMSNDLVHPSYFQEKLGLDRFGAEAFSEFWGKVCNMRKEAYEKGTDGGFEFKFSR